MGRILFGTDGIRGRAGEPPIDGPTAYALGAALGEWASHKATPAKILFGRDTRESGEWLGDALAAGLASRQVEPVNAGLITTPGVAWNTKSGPFVAGVMISASHNPYYDNGLKVFDHSGFKLPDSVEEELEESILRIRSTETASALSVPVDESLDGGYLAFLKSLFPAFFSLKGIKLVVDCANGAAAELGPKLFESLGAEVVATGNEPNGRNINDGVGALHTDHLATMVRRKRADLGIAFDGDADRAMFISPKGKLIDGDAVLYIVGRRLKSMGHLPESRVIATVMSNLGLEVALREEGITLGRTNVGDKYVLEEMIRSGVVLGGEQSGHVIFSEHATTGDGMLTALKVLEAMVGADKTLDELTTDIQNYPQILVNVKIRERKPIAELPPVQECIAACEADFGDKGRVLVRFSGTEPLARVMVEGNDEDKVNSHAHAIADALKEAIGA